MSAIEILKLKAKKRKGLTPYIDIAVKFKVLPCDSKDINERVYNMDIIDTFKHPMDSEDCWVEDVIQYDEDTDVFYFKEMFEDIPAVHGLLKNLKDIVDGEQFKTVAPDEVVFINILHALSLFTR